MRNIFILLFTLLIAAALPAQQQQRYKSLTEALQSGGQMAGRNGPSSVNWIDGGNRFSFIPPGGGVIKTYDPATDKEETVFTAQGMTFPGTDKPFAYNQFNWSADFKYLMFRTNFRPVWRNSGDADYYLYSLADKQLQLVAKDARTAQLSPNGQMVAYERGGNLFVYDLNKKKETQLTKDAQTNLYNGRYGWVYEEEFGLVQAWDWSPDSRYIAFWQTDERQIPLYKMTDFSDAHPQYTEIPYPRVGDPAPPVKLGIIDLKSRKNKWVNIDLAGGYFPRIYWTSKSGQLAVVHLNRKQNQLTLYFAEAASGNARKIMEEKDDKGWIDIFDFFAGILHFFTFPANSEEFFWISGRDGFNHLYRYNYEGKLLNQVTSGQWEVVRVESVDVANKTVYYTSTEASPLDRQLYGIGFDGAGKRRLTQPEGRHRINMSPNGKYYIDNHSSTSRHKRVELFTSDGKLVKVMEANDNIDKFLQSHAYSPRELVRFTTTDGQPIDIYIVKPLDFDPQKKYPLLLEVYGGPGSQAVYNEFGASGWEQYMAQEGYVIAGVNNRGSGGYGQDFMEVVYEQLGTYESKDFVQTAQYLSKNNAWIDGSRMAIKGHSYGGFTSSYTMLTHPGVFQVAIVAAPVTDQRLYDNIYTERYMGLLPENEENYKKTSVITYADKLEGKMLLVHSLMDDNVHVVNTFQLLRKLLDNGKDVDLRIYPPGDHGVAYDFGSFVLLQTTYHDYLQTHLKK